MRGIAAGQTLHLILIEEVQHLIKKAVGEGKSPQADTVAWLLLNEMRTATMQATKLSEQSLLTVYRRHALERILKRRLGREENHDGDAEFAINVFRESIGVLQVESTVPRDVGAIEQLMARTQPWASLVQSREDQEEINRHIGALGSTVDSEGNALDVEVVCEIEQEVEQEVEEEQEVANVAAVGSGLDASWPLAQLATIPKGLNKEATTSGFFAYLLDAFRVPHSPEMGLGFPDSCLLSKNVAPLQWTVVEEPRLRTAAVLLHWMPNGCQVPFTVALSLQEADSLRRVIQARNATGKAAPEGGMSLQLQGGTTLISTGGFGTDSHEVHSARQCVRFWNNELWFEQDELKLVAEALFQSSPKDREAYYRATSLCRRMGKLSLDGSSIQSLFG